MFTIGVLKLWQETEPHTSG